LILKIYNFEQATDADKGDNEKIRYRFDKLETKFIIDELTGELYPVDGEFNYKAHIMQVLALDDEGNNGALQDMITITVRILLLYTVYNQINDFCFCLIYIYIEVGISVIKFMLFILPGTNCEGRPSCRSSYPRSARRRCRKHY